MPKNNDKNVLRVVTQPFRDDVDYILLPYIVTYTKCLLYLLRLLPLPLVTALIVDRLVGDNLSWRH